VINVSQLCSIQAFVRADSWLGNTSYVLSTLAVCLPFLNNSSKLYRLLAEAQRLWTTYRRLLYSSAVTGSRTCDFLLTCPMPYHYITMMRVDAYAQPTRQHCWYRRHDALPLVIKHFQLLRHAPGTAFPWLFVAREHCLHSAGSLRLTCITVLLTNSNSVTVFRIHLQSTFSFIFF